MSEPEPTQIASMIKNSVVLFVFLFLVIFSALQKTTTGALQQQVVLSGTERVGMLKDVREMFDHAFNGYLRCAFPKDELRPISCTGTDAPIIGGHALTLVDTLDTIALMGNKSQFQKAVRWISANLSFDHDVSVSVFETNIRLVGGLLSGHFLCLDRSLDLLEGGAYDGALLSLAVDLARRLLPAFDTVTGVPYGTVNLRTGVPKGETPITSTAGGGTYAIEFGIVSRLTGNPIYEQVARSAMRGLWSRRSTIGLVGNHINVQTGEWTHKDTGIGAGVDSLFEYMYKAALLFGDPEYMEMWSQALESIERYVRKDRYYMEVHMQTGAVVWPLVNSLGNFWPGLLALAGEIDLASKTMRSLHEVWRKFGAMPEGFNVHASAAQQGQKGYPLRPELAESAYFLYRATGDRFWQVVGRDIVTGLQTLRVAHGYAAVEDVDTRVLRDNMDSFFLAETLKYLFLLFDSDNVVSRGQYVFNTEGHFFPMNISIMTPTSLPPLASSSIEGAGIVDRCRRPSYATLLSVDGVRMPDYNEINMDAVCNAL